MRSWQLAYLSLILIAAAVVVPVFVIVGTVILFWLTPVVFFIGCLFYPFLKRLMYNAADRTKCCSCGKYLQKRSVQTAMEWSREAARDERIGRVRRVDAICQHCGAWYDFDFKKGEFVATGRPDGVHA